MIFLGLLTVYNVLIHYEWMELLMSLELQAMNDNAFGFFKLSYPFLAMVAHALELG